MLVFIVDSEIITAETMRAKLRAGGFEVEMNNGAEESEIILELIRAKQPSYIILNLDLTNGQGKQLLFALKSDKLLSSLPIFVYSYTNNYVTPESCQQWDVDYFFDRHQYSVNEFLASFIKIIKNLAF
ncbi:response regulator [Candidatus Parcubacteria bacterium]|nr:MAG: response regulator [Candidatus Parcubacteria bacterium]